MKTRKSQTIFSLVMFFVASAWSLSSTASPMLTSGFDVCMNIYGVQKFPPRGFFAPSNGTKTLLFCHEKIDMCHNIPGTQKEVPKNMKMSTSEFNVRYCY